MNSIPKIRKKKILIKRASEDSWIMKFKQHPYSNPMTINATSYDIISFLDGTHTTKDIVHEICNKYNISEEAKVEHDIMKLIAFLWDFKVLDWIGDDPFEKIFKFCNDDYTFTLVREYKSLNLIKERTYLSTYINPNVELSIHGLEIASFYSGLQCFLGTSNKNQHSIEVAVRFSRVDLSINLEALYINKLEQNDIDIFSELMKYIYAWNLKNSNIVDKNNIVVIKAHTLYSCNILESLGFQFIGLSENDTTQGDVKNYCKCIELSNRLNSHLV